MLDVEIYAKGTVRIKGTEEDLRKLAERALEAAVLGHAEGPESPEKKRLLIERID